VSDTPDRPHEPPEHEPAPPTQMAPPARPPAPSPYQPPAAPQQSPAPYQPPGSPYQPPGSPYQQPGAPYQPAAPYPAPSPYQPKRTSGGGIAAIVIVVILVVVLLFCGGIGAFIWWVASSVDDAIPDRDRPGGPDNPIMVEVGEAFTIDDFAFEQGWTLTSNALGDPDIEDLRTENTGASSDSINVTLTFVADDEELGEISCSSSNVQPDRTVTTTCYGSGDIAGHDEIEVSTSW
jgi:hypothetical protein